MRSRVRITQFVSAASVALLLGAAAPARSQSAPELKQSSDHQNRTVVGVVKEYEPGKALMVTTRDNNVETFKLDDVTTSLRIVSTISVGKNVRVIESTNAAGEKSLTIEPESSPLQK